MQWKEFKSWRTVETILRTVSSGCAISSAYLYFLTQKEGARFRAKSCVPVSIQRRTQDESGLLSQLAQWVLFNLHGDEEELLTLRWKV